MDQPASTKKAVVKAGKELLSTLSPMNKLTTGRLDELVDVAIVEEISKDLDPTRMSEQGVEAVYLVKGDLGIRYTDGKKILLRGGTAAAKHPISSERLKIKDTIAITPIEVIRIDLDLLDIMLTWDQIANYSKSDKPQSKASTAEGGAKIDSERFDAFKLKNGVFNKIPAANIETLLERLNRVQVKAGQKVVTQGQEGDYYYLIDQGKASVSRIIDGKPPVVLAELGEGDAFGEEALASETKRNATVEMATDGYLFRLKKEDFVELLKKPVVNMIDKTQAEQKIKDGAVWLDVRFESEFEYHHLDGAINVPIHSLREKLDWIDSDKTYIVYCQTGRRSSAAAFILAQYGVNALVLEGGTRSNGL